MMNKEKFPDKNNEGRHKIIVDVGAGLSPLSWYFSEIKELKNKTYLAIDVNDEYLRLNRDAINSLKTFLEEPLEAFYLLAKGENILLKSGSVDEVFLGNFLGIPNLDEKIKLAVLGECFRILKPEGLLKVFENYTPPYGKVKEKLKETINNIGFKLEKEKDKKELEREVDIFQLSPGSFYLIFKKPSEKGLETTD